MGGFARFPKQAFSLVELSIVLVILGLLVGGVLSGQSLIRAAELRSVTRDLGNYRSAVYAFRDKYFALPGDMANATTFWGTDNVGCPNGGGSSGTCNGDGDGNIGSPTGVGNICEVQEFWRQLALAGLIEGHYTPNTTVNCFANTTPGQDSAKLSLNSAGLMITAVENITSNAAFPGNALFIGNYSNTFFAGLSSANGINMNPFLKPEEAWNIDTKMDDGDPATGIVRTIYPGIYGPAVGTTSCVTTNVVSTAQYNLSNSSTACALVVDSGF